MYRTSLVGTMAYAFDNWWSRRGDRKVFKRWLKGGVMDLRATGLATSPSGSWPAADIRLAAMCGVDEVLFADRLLRGIRGIETRDDFWSLDGGNALKDWVAAGPKPLTPEDVTHMTRCGSFTRIDQYYVLPELGTVLRGGVGVWCQDSLEVMREVLSRSWTLEIIRDPGPDGDAIRGTKAVIKAGPPRPGVEFSYTIAYSA